jgi:hypothetical protein
MTTVAPAQVVFTTPRDVHAATRADAERVSWVVVPATRWFLIEGTSAPGDDAFRAAIGTLYPVAYTLHFALKRRGVQAPIGALEGIYTVAGGSDPAAVLTADAAPPGGWSWQLLQPVPDAATDDEVTAAIEDVRHKGKGPALERLRVEPIPATRAAQIVHLGAFDAEQPTIRKLLDAIAAVGLRPAGGHHEIYLSDPNRTPAARLRTLLRFAVRD